MAVNMFILLYERPFCEQRSVFTAGEPQMCVPMGSPRGKYGYTEKAIRCYDTLEEAANNAYDNQSIWRLSTGSMVLTKVRDAKPRREKKRSNPNAEEQSN